MGGVKSLIKGPPKPKQDDEAKKLQKEQLRLEQQRAESADRALEASRRARLAGGGSARSGLAYTGTNSGGTLG